MQQLSVYNRYEPVFLIIVKIHPNIKETLHNLVIILHYSHIYERRVISIWQGW